MGLANYEMGLANYEMALASYETALANYETEDEWWLPLISLNSWQLPAKTFDFCQCA